LVEAIYIFVHPVIFIVGLAIIMGDHNGVQGM